MKRKNKFAVILLLVATLVLTIAPGIASAHEQRVVVGKYAFVVGFLNEPAYAGELNSIDLTICDGTACKRDDKGVITNPVNDADKSLKVEVSFGANPALALPIAPRYNTPGKYSGYFTPSKVGAYTFHIFGNISGNNIDEKFTSGPKTFGEAQELTIYPAVDSGANLQTQIKEAKDSASSASLFGIVGIVVGVLGLAVGGFALTRKPKAFAATARDKELVGSQRG
jgi:hypothetical protein